MRPHDCNVELFHVKKYVHTHLKTHLKQSYYLLTVIFIILWSSQKIVLCSKNFNFYQHR